jgi:hypothetical protein
VRATIPGMRATISGLRASALATLLCFAPIACTHRVSINSNPTGARTYVDNQFIGLTPATFVEKSGLGRKYQVRLEKDGYRTLTAQEKQGVNAVYVLFSLLFTCGVGILWSFTLDDRYDYSLERG